MKTIIALIVFIACISSSAQNNSFADRSAAKFLIGLMANEKDFESDKMAPGFFIGAEVEVPFSPNSIGRSFVPYFAPELNYWHVQNSKNVSVGVNLRGKFKGGTTRPYVDLGVTFNRVTRASVDYTRPGFNAGAGIDVQLGKTHISFVFDFKVRAIIYESSIKAGFSMTPGFRMAF